MRRKECSSRQRSASSKASIFWVTTISWPSWKEILGRWRNWWLPLRTSRVRKTCCSPSSRIPRPITGTWPKPGSCRGVEALVALALARSGHIAEAQKLANKLNKDFPLYTFFQSYWLPAIRAAIELNRKNPAGSIELLRSTASYEMGVPEPLLIVGTMYPVYLRGETYLLVHEGKEAAAEFQKIIDHPGVVVN